MARQGGELLRDGGGGRERGGVLEDAEAYDQRRPADSGEADAGGVLLVGGSPDDIVLAEENGEGGEASGDEIGAWGGNRGEQEGQGAGGRPLREAA